MFLALAGTDVRDVTAGLSSLSVLDSEPADSVDVSISHSERDIILALASVKGCHLIYS